MDLQRPIRRIKREMNYDRNVIADPRTPAISRYLLAAALHQGSIFRFLRKPWESDELKRAIADALDLNHLITNERRLRNELAKANEEHDTKVKELDETNLLLEY
jgi:hypothetical protein